MVGISSLFLSAAVLFSGTVVLVLSSDVNWGKKVDCFIVQETVVCPGCNYRAGLSCPRNLKNSRNCLEPTTQILLKAQTTKQPKITYKELNVTEADLKYNSTTQEENEIQKEPTKIPFDMNIYLYRLLDSKFPSYRYKRELEQKEEPETCNWNGDCPCPLICCKTGPGCPKQCVMGIRLPPPWG